MNKSGEVSLLAVIVFLCSFQSLGSEGHALDAELALKDVPKVIMNAVHEAFPDVKAVTAGTRSKHGKLQYYDIDVVRNKEKFDVYLNVEGTILCTAVAVSLKRLPSAIRDVLVKSYKDWTFDEAERQTDYKTQKVTYSVEIIKEKKTLEINFDPTGKLISEEDVSDD